jgi:hypothetical protein
MGRFLLMLEVVANMRTGVCCQWHSSRTRMSVGNGRFIQHGILSVSLGVLCGSSATRRIEFRNRVS